MNSEVFINNDKLNFERLLIKKINPYYDFSCQTYFSGNNNNYDIHYNGVYLVLNKDIIPISNRFGMNNNIYAALGKYYSLFYENDYGKFLCKILEDCNEEDKNLVKKITLRDIINCVNNNKDVKSHVSEIKIKYPHTGSVINYFNLNRNFNKNGEYRRANDLYSKWAIAINGEILFLRYIHRDNICSFINVSNMISILKQLDKEYFKDKINELNEFLNSIVITRVCNKLIDKRNKKKKLKEIVIKYLEEITTPIIYQEEILNDEVLFKLKKPEGKTPKEIKANIFKEIIDILGVKEDE